MPETLEHEIRAVGGAVTRRQLGSTTFDRLCRSGRLIRVQPAVAVLPECIDDLAVRALAAGLVDPDAVIVAAAAAALTWCPRLSRPGLTVESASPRVHPRSDGYRWSRAQIPAELVVERGPVRLACAELSVLQLIPVLGGSVVDEALRTRAVTLDGLYEVLEMVPGRVGNTICRQVLADSKDSPWSEAERLAHRALRSSRVTGWRSNLLVRLPPSPVFSGRKVFLDIGFQRLLLGLEIDGTTYHSSPAAMEHDRRRDIALALQGWSIVRFPASEVASPSWISTVQELIRLREITLGVAS